MDVVYLVYTVGPQGQDILEGVYGERDFALDVLDSLDKNAIMFTHNVLYRNKGDNHDR